MDIEYKSKLKRGAKGEQVKLVQQRLTTLGYFTGPISGNYMNQTVEAIKQFQTNNGLKADGHHRRGYVVAALTIRWRWT